MAVIIVLAVAVAYLGSRPRSEPDAGAWPASVRTNFVNACMSTGGSASECSCYYSGVQEKVTYDEYVAAESNYVGGGTLPPSILNAAIACLEVDSLPATLSPSQVLARSDELMRATFADFAYEARSWRRFDDILGDTICITVDFTNIGRVDGAPRTWEFSLVGPTGHLKTTAYVVDSVSLMTQRVVPGASGSGELCFLSGDELGDFTLRWRDSVFGGQRDWPMNIN